MNWSKQIREESGLLAAFQADYFADVPRASANG
jgi:hypothetical protein